MNSKYNEKEFYMMFHRGIWLSNLGQLLIFEIAFSSVFQHTWGGYFFKKSLIGSE